MESTRIGIAGDACMFVLDDSGIALSESRQELHVLNPPATLIWCLLEDGCSWPHLVDEYGAVFERAPSEAVRDIASVLTTWFRLGYISGPPPVVEGATSLAS